MAVIIGRLELALSGSPRQIQNTPPRNTSERRQMAKSLLAQSIDLAVFRRPHIQKFYPPYFYGRGHENWPISS
jgi:hypothetical protein